MNSPLIPVQGSHDSVEYSVLPAYAVGLRDLGSPDPEIFRLDPLNDPAIKAMARAGKLRPGLPPNATHSLLPRFRQKRAAVRSVEHHVADAAGCCVAGHPADSDAEAEWSRK